MFKHFDEIKELVLTALKKYSDCGCEFQVVRNVFGRITIYIISLTELEDDKIQLLKDQIINTLIIDSFLDKEWLDTIESLDINSGMYLKLKEVNIKMEDNPLIYFTERHITRLNWFANKNYSIYESPILKEKKSRVITFYSFKGGVGRTTSLVLTALTLVRQGKKVVVVDFDLEAPGLSTILPVQDMEYPKYGVVDYIIESQIFKEKQIDIDQYIYPFSEKEVVGTEGGQMFVFQASNLDKDNSNEYIEKIGRIDFGMPQYFNANNPVCRMLENISSRFNPDYIFIDARTGIHDIGGLTLSKYSDLAALVFYGNKQNISGMRMVINKIKEIGIPFLLINSPVPPIDAGCDEEIAFYAENAHKIFIEAGIYNENNMPDINEEGADHYPYNIKYSQDAAFINSSRKIRTLLESDGKENAYLKLAEEISARFDDSSLQMITTDYITKRPKMLAAISNIIDGRSASAENDFKTAEDMRKNFFPLKDHKFIFDNDIFLVTGPKGSGKTALFKVLEHTDYAQELAISFLGVSPEYIRNTIWITGLKQGAEYPGKTNFNAVAQASQEVDYYTRYWEIILVRSIYSFAIQYLSVIPREIQDIATSDLNDLRKMAVSADYAEKIEEFLFKLDKELQSKNRNVIITYDALDLILEKKYRGLMIAALISMWFEFLWRFKNIRAKIFLRDDIFNKEINEGLTDKVKLKNYTANIMWDYDNLLAMIWKRIAERSLDMVNFFNDSLKTLGLSIIKHGDFIGYIPKADSDANKCIIKSIIGEKMGSSNKAYTNNWILYHLSDAKNNILPRSILALFALAAREEKEEEYKNNTALLIRPKNFEGVMLEVSQDRVDDLKEEYGEYNNILINMKNYTNKRFPLNEEDLTDVLIHCGVKLNEVKAVINDFIEIGIMKQYQRKLSDPIRYHIPDIFLSGLGLKRYGPGAS